MAVHDTGRDEILTTHYIEDHVKDIDITITTKEIMSPLPNQEKLQLAETRNNSTDDESIQIVRHMNIDAPGLRTRVEVTGK